jgi:dienelactone hydrolase
MRRYLSLLAVILLPLWARAEPLSGTKPLERSGDLAAAMVEGIDKYLMRELEESPKKRKGYWKDADVSSPEAWAKSVQPKRERLKKLLGMVEERLPVKELNYVGGTGQPTLVAETDTYRVHPVRWPVFPGVDGDGLLLEPKGKVIAQVVALPDADWTPEMIAGLAPGLEKDGHYARLLAENGCRVLVPTLIDRKDTWSGNPRVGRMTNQPHREFIYRMAYQMGRHIIGYEVQKVLAAVDWFTREKGLSPVGVVGYGEGGLVAYHCAQIDTRIHAVLIAGYDFPNNHVWQTPIYRNVWRLLPEFDDTSNTKSPDVLIVPRRLIIDAHDQPAVVGPPPPRAGRGGAAPGRIEKEGGLLFTNLGLGHEHPFQISVSVYVPNGDQRYVIGGRALADLSEKITGAKEGSHSFRAGGEPPTDARKGFDPGPRQKRQFDQLVNFIQQIMRDSERVRAANFWAKLDTSSLEKFQASTEPFRKQLWEEILGKLPAPTEPMNPQSRQLYDEPKWRGYEVTLDLYPDVFAHGILLVPKDLKEGEKRPVIVCQHGLEGKPTDVVNPTKRTPYYNSFGAQLADRGYIVYAPQNPYIGHDKFRVLQRKANPLGLSLFSFIIRQHERTLDWLASLPFVDPERMAFYGLSYGGKTAMRVPAVLSRYCLSICSGDFNEWTWKNASIDYVNSYMFSGEYEMPEFNLGSTLVYAEMAALIAPRPFMVERGHDDPVGIDEWVAYEYAKVRRLYSRLKIPERTEIEFFAGGHEIHGVGTFAFLQKHLKWPH